MTPTERRILLRCAELSAQVYERAPGHSGCKLVESGAAQMIWTEDAKHIYACVRGTQVTENWSWPDIAANFNMGLAPWWRNAIAHAHSGYQDQAYALTSAVAHLVHGARARKKDLILTGHSMGGAVAQLLGARFNAIPFVRVVSFGAPRVGDSIMMLMQCPIQHSIVFENDIAPKHPAFLHGYRSPATEWHLHADGVLHVRTPKWYHKMIVPLTPWGVTAGFLDHRVQNYVDALRLTQQGGSTPSD